MYVTEKMRLHKIHVLYLIQLVYSTSRLAIRFFETFTDYPKKLTSMTPEFLNPSILFQKEKTSSMALSASKLTVLLLPAPRPFSKESKQHRSSFDQKNKFIWMNSLLAALAESSL